MLTLEVACCYPGPADSRMDFKWTWTGTVHTNHVLNSRVLLLFNETDARVQFRKN